MTSIGGTPSPSWRMPAAVGALGLAGVLSLVWLLLPPTGSDLSAQVAHADFARAHVGTPVDLRWFGGTGWLGYSVVAPPLMAVLGVRLVGALATVASAGLLGLLLTRWRVPRPFAGALVGALCLVANLVVGRLTFALGTAAALATLLAVPLSHWSRWLLLVGGALVTWAASPLAALFLGVVAVALILRRRRGLDGAVLAMAVVVGLAASVWVGQGGYMPAPVDRGIAGLAACGLLALVSRYPLIRIGALLAGGGIVLALVIPTPIGMNALRLPELFVPPLAVATSRLSMRWVVPAVVVAVCWLPPLTGDDITAIGEPSSSASYYTELTTELAKLPLTGRVEIPPTLQRWEAVYVADDVPLARGWMTQLDDGYNPLFFDESLGPDSYRRWLRANAVQYVAVADDAPAEAGAAETSLIRSGLPFLRAIWSGQHWTLYRVASATATVTGAQLVSQDPVSVTFRVAEPVAVGLRVRWSRWLTLAGPAGCLRPDGTWTHVVVRRPGVYRVGSALTPGGRNDLCAAP